MSVSQVGGEFREAGLHVGVNLDFDPRLAVKTPEARLPLWSWTRSRPSRLPENTR